MKKKPKQAYVIYSLCIIFWIDCIRVEIMYKTLDTYYNHYMSFWEHADDQNCQVVRLSSSLQQNRAEDHHSSQNFL